MRLLRYLQSLIFLLTSPKYFSEKVISSIEESREISKWATPSQHLFFDIDDTLGIHRGGLNEEICINLNTLVNQGKSVYLLTNCSLSRANEHKDRLKRYQCKATLWPHGQKPDHVWLKQELSSKGLKAEDCSFYGDRPTMDLWMAWKAGFGHRIWIKGWRSLSKDRTGPLRWIQNLEWRRLNPQFLETES
jgi:hypothetical protein